MRMKPASPDTSDMDERAASPAPTMPPPPPRSVSWLDTPVCRNKTTGKTGGVVSGLAEAFGFDLRTSRIAVAIGALVMPPVIAVYVALLILLPKSPSEAVTFRQLFTERRRRPFVFAIVAVCMYISVSTIDSRIGFHGLSWGLGLVVVGALLWSVSGRSSSGSPTMPPPIAGNAPLPPPSVHWTPTSPVTSGLPMTAIRRRPTRRIGSGLAAIGLATIALIATGDLVGWWNVSVVGLAVATLIVVMVATVLSSIVNRSFVPLGGTFLLAPVLAFLLVVQPNLSGGIGNRVVRPATTPEAQVSQHLGIGELTVDLGDGQILPPNATLSVNSEVGLGRLHVLVPATATLELDTRVGAGHVVVDGREIEAGVRHHDVSTNRAAVSGGPTIHLRLRVGAGEIAVDRLVTGGRG